MAKDLRKLEETTSHGVLNRMITREDLRKYSLEMLEVLRRERITSYGELEEKLGQSFDASEGKIQLEVRPSGPGSSAYAISYIIYGKGIPIEIRMDNVGRYSKITLKAENKIEGYSAFIHDIFGNLMQDKRFEFSFNRIREELEKISK